MYDPPRSIRFDPLRSLRHAALLIARASVDADAGRPAASPIPKVDLRCSAHKQHQDEPFSQRTVGQMRRLTAPSAREVYLRGRWSYQRTHSIDGSVHKCRRPCARAAQRTSFESSKLWGTARCISSLAACASSDRAGVSKGHPPGWSAAGATTHQQALPQESTKQQNIHGYMFRRSCVADTSFCVFFTSYYAYELAMLKLCVASCC